MWVPGGLAAEIQSLSEASQDLFTRGVAALQDERLDEALAAFDAVLQKGGKIAAVYNNLGIVHQRRGDHDKAIQYLRQAVRLAPSDAAPRALLGASLLALGQLPPATSQLERAVHLAPEEPQVRVQLARAYERSGNFAGVVDQYLALRRLRPDEPEYSYQLGLAYRKLSEWSLEQIKRVQPRSGRLYQALGQHYMLQGKADLALRAFRQAAEADPLLPEIHLALAEIHLGLCNRDDVSREVELELALVPRSRAALDLKQKLESK